MRMTTAQIAKLVAGKVIGDERLVICGVSGIKEAKDGEITFLSNQKYSALALKSKASAIIVPRSITLSGKTVIQAENPSLAFSKVVSSIAQRLSKVLKGIHPTAIIGEKVKLAKGVALGPYVVVDEGAVIGKNTAIHAGVYVGPNTIIGEDCLIYPRVTVLEKISIGSRVIIHSGTVIGADGFGYININGAHHKIPQVGTVVIEDDVEIGANVTIDRARFDKTFIGKGTKIDNLVQIAHNVIIGENCIIVAQVGIGGSVELKKSVILAGQVGVGGHLTIGEGVIVGAQSAVMKSVPAFTQVMGTPARVQRKAMEANAHLQRLGHYVAMINELHKRIETLEEKFKKEK